MPSTTPEAPGTPGQIVVLNGAPRSGKTSIARAMQTASSEIWLNLGVDAFAAGIVPAGLAPDIGLDPGGERPDLEPHLERLYAALYEGVATIARIDMAVVVDVGHHDAYSHSLRTLPNAARRLAGLPILFVGLHCPIEEIMARRNQGGGTYLRSTASEPIPAPVALWQAVIHRPWLYDLELDTSRLSPRECAELIFARLASGPPGQAFPALLDRQ